MVPADQQPFAELSGIAFDCVASLRPDAPSFREAVLLTHRGLSGPAILQISSYWRAGETMRLNLLPDHSRRPICSPRTGPEDAT